MILIDVVGGDISSLIHESYSVSINISNYLIETIYTLLYGRQNNYSYLDIKMYTRR